MKLLIFAHTPPPFHGQSYMVELLLRSLREGAQKNIDVFHVNARLSNSIDEIGSANPLKLIYLLGYCLKALACRLKNGGALFYYVPAPPKRLALYRDWVVMLACRPFFRTIILHWQASGLGEWLEHCASPWEQRVTYKLLGDAKLSIVMSELGRADAERLKPREITVIPNGIPDPFPEYETSVLPKRLARFAQRVQPNLMGSFRILFLSTLTIEKGLFVTLEATRLLAREVAQQRQSIRLDLAVAGEFTTATNRERFVRSARAIGAESGNMLTISYAGFVEAPEKYELMTASDCLCFPTTYRAEGQPVTIIEALACGLPVAATRWRSIPEMLEGTDSMLIDTADPELLCAALLKLFHRQPSMSGRDRFLARYELGGFTRNFVKSLRRVAGEGQLA
jgi:glycosyltransferase involved in cell wall biosynthesis